MIKSTTSELVRNELVEALKLDLGPLMLEEGGARRPEQPNEVRPGVRSTHIDDPDGFYARSGRLDTEEARGLAALHAAPELLLSGQQKVLVQAISRDRHLDPFAAAGDDREAAAAAPRGR